MAVPHFEDFIDTSGRHRWRLVAGNGEKVATSGEAFSDRYGAIRAARRVKELAALAEVVDSEREALVEAIVRMLKK